MSKNITVFLNKITYRIMKNDGYISNDLSPVEIDTIYCDGVLVEKVSEAII